MFAYVKIILFCSETLVTCVKASSKLKKIENIEYFYFTQKEVVKQFGVKN